MMPSIVIATPTMKLHWYGDSVYYRYLFADMDTMLRTRAMLEQEGVKTRSFCCSTEGSYWVEIEANTTMVLRPR